MKRYGSQSYLIIIFLHKINEQQGKNNKTKKVLVVFAMYHCFGFLMTFHRQTFQWVGLFSPVKNANYDFIYVRHEYLIVTVEFKRI